MPHLAEPPCIQTEAAPPCLSTAVTQQAACLDAFDQDSLQCVLARLSADDHLPVALTCRALRDAVYHLLRGACIRTRLSAIARRRPADFRSVVTSLSARRSRALHVAAAAGGDVETLEWLRAQSTGTAVWSHDTERAAIAGAQTEVLHWAERHGLLTRPLDELLPPIHQLMGLALLAEHRAAAADPPVPDAHEMLFTHGFQLAHGLFNLGRGRTHSTLAQAFVDGVQQAIDQAPPVDAPLLGSHAVARLLHAPHATDRTPPTLSDAADAPPAPALAAPPAQAASAAAVDAAAAAGADPVGEPLVELD
jgi:hypothetical protein